MAYVPRTRGAAALLELPLSEVVPVERLGCERVPEAVKRVVDVGVEDRDSVEEDDEETGAAAMGTAKEEAGRAGDVVNDCAYCGV